MLIELLSVYLLTGAAAGLLAGLLGVGGGVVVVPALVWSFARIGVPIGLRMHLAVGTSLASIIVTGSTTAVAYWRRGAVHGRALRGLTPGLMLGSLMGGVLARSIPTHGLRLLFAIFLIAVAIRMQWQGGSARSAGRKGASRHRSTEATDRHSGVVNASRAASQLPAPGWLSVAGGVIGLLSGLVGIGGGTLTVPFLTWFEVPLRTAVGTSSAAAIAIALCGTMSFVWSGWSVSGLPPHSSGYVYWPALAALAPTALLAAPFGARLAHRLPMAVIRRAFGVLLLIVAGKMLLSPTG